jgi:hypothetical protein
MIFDQNRGSGRPQSKIGRHDSQQWLIRGNFVLRERTPFKPFPSLYSDRLLDGRARQQQSKPNPYDH